MNGFLIQILLFTLGIFAAAGLLLWSAATIRYRVTEQYLRISWLGVPLRWVRLANIKHVGNRPVFWAERWPSALFDSRRMLVIRRRRGLFRNLVITPQYPFEFKAALERASKAQTGKPIPAPPSTTGNPSEKNAA
jgi:hypothetical protein